MCNYALSKKTKRKNLWGNYESNIIYREILSLIENENEITFDFKEIKTIDYSFIDEVFINITKSAQTKDKKLIFKNIENESVQYYLTKAFYLNNVTALIEKNNETFSIGKEEEPVI